MGWSEAREENNESQEDSNDRTAVGCQTGDTSNTYETRDTGGETGFRSAVRFRLDLDVELGRGENWRSFG